MCSICGKLDIKGGRRIEKELIDRMNSIMHYCGPDDSVAYFSKRVGLGHRRLAIIDLKSDEQPLFNER